MTQHDDSLYLAHISDAISRVESYLKDIEQPDFQTNQLLQDGVIRQLQIIGEAVKRISPETRAKARNVEWSLIAKTRDKLIHDYFGVDLEVVWYAATRDLPALKTEIEKLL